MKSDKGMSFIEIIITLFIVTVAVLPLLTSIGSTGRGVYSMGKHQIAGLVARSLLDRLMQLPFAECRNKCLELGSETLVTADADFAKLSARIAFDAKDYDRMNFKVNVTDASTAEEQSLMFVIEVTVSWPVANSNTRRDLSFRAIKYETRI
ncbi:MAG TPA: hypothetical protein PLM07_19580 [Candidatus Rifleibacterium sp.]|nr:hypothetical protein [Candidatus Rifleibacterium sp.]